MACERYNLHRAMLEHRHTILLHSADVLERPGGPYFQTMGSELLRGHYFMTSHAGVAFAHLNLRRNPFGTLTPDELAQLAVVLPLDGVIARLSGSGRFAILFTGEKGRGKSTHLRALQYALPHATYCFFPENGPAPIIPSTGVLLLDELQRMPGRARARLFRTGRMLAIGSHEDHTAELRAAGYVVEHRRLAGPDVATLTALIAQRIEACRRVPGDVPRVTPAAIERLHARHRGDVRALLDELYDVFQTLEAPSDVEM